MSKMFFSFLILFLILPLFVFAEYEKTVIELKPVGYWRFEEKSAKSGAKDSSKVSGSQIGTFQGMVKKDFAQAGPDTNVKIHDKSLKGFSRFNKALRFNGTDSEVRFSDDDGNLNLSENWAFTLSLWVKSEGEQKNGAALIAKGLSGGGEQFCVDVNKGTYRFFVRNGENAATDAQSMIKPSGEWQHIVAICDSSNSVMKIFVDGIEAISWSPPETLLDTMGYPMTIGCREQSEEGTFGNHFSGLIDEVAVWKRALTQKEIAGLFLSAFGKNQPNIASGPTEPSADLLAKANDENGFQPLFNKDLSDALTTNGWSWNKDGVLSHSQMNSDLYTKKLYKDFVLDLEFKTVWDTNSGVFLRCSNLNNWINTAIEAQILQQNDKVGKKAQACGGIFDCLAPVAQYVNATGEWNHYKIIANDNWIFTYINGNLAASMDLNLWETASLNPNGTKNKFKIAYKDLPRYGHLGLQDHGQKIYFRNVMVKELTPVTSEEKAALDSGVKSWLENQEKKMRRHAMGDIKTIINLKKKNSNNCVCYMQAGIWSANDQKARLEVGSDDGIKVFLNGDVVHTNNVMRGLKLNEDKIDVELKKGWNVLLMKVSNGAVGFEAAARLVSRDNKSLKDVIVLKNGIRDPNKINDKQPKRHGIAIGDTDNYVTQWVISEPFRKKDMTPIEMLDYPFSAEKKENPQFRWRKK